MVTSEWCADCFTIRTDPSAKQAQTLCPGYTASNVERTENGLTATLNLAGSACNVYGTDIETLALEVQDSITLAKNRR